MRSFVILSLLLSGLVYGAETVVLSTSKTNGTVSFVFTDSSMNLAAEKYLGTTTCAMRFQASNSVRENIVSLPCKAEVIKFVLNNGYKLIDRNVYAK